MTENELIFLLVFLILSEFAMFIFIAIFGMVYTADLRHEEKTRLTYQLADTLNEIAYSMNEIAMNLERLQNE